VSATIVFSGWNEFKVKAKNLPQVMFDEIDGECEDAIHYWEQLAKTDAPKDQGFLAQNINSKTVGLMHYELVSGALYSAYREWGTGAMVSVPANLVDYAILFKGKGIREVNSRPQPYFFVQMPIVEKFLFTNLQNNVLNKEH